jgi:uncharacterized YigZ family protein
MLFDDTYQSIARPSEGIYRDKGSKFMAYAIPIKHEDEVKEKLLQIKTEHPKARHHCWAWRLGPDRTVFKLNDDGEPSGTAGRPILNSLLSVNVTNILVVVVRYFGGTLLGVPGLINAYKCASQDALSQAEIITQYVTDIYLLTFDYIEMNTVMRIIKEENLAVRNQQFDNLCSISVEIRQSLVNLVLARFEKINGLRANYQKTV